MGRKKKVIVEEVINEIAEVLPKEELPLKEVIKVVTKITDKPIKYNCFQACNHFKLSGGNRRVATIKFSGQYNTLEDWELLLKTNKLLN